MAVKTKGIRFIGRNKAIVNIKRHAEIMEDAMDRIAIKEAMQKADFVSWNEVEQKINKKLGITHDVHDTANKTGRKKPAKNK